MFKAVDFGCFLFFKQFLFFFKKFVPCLMLLCVEYIEGVKNIKKEG